LHELATNMPVFPRPWPRTKPEALAALISLLGHPPEGVFTKAFCPKHSYLAPHANKPRRQERQEPMAKLVLPEKRQSLESLCTLGLDCLWWNASDRPETDYCLKSLKTAQAHSELSSEADFVWLRLEDEELREPASSSKQLSSSKQTAAEPAKAAEPAEVTPACAGNNLFGSDLEAGEVAAVKDNEDQDTLLYDTGAEDWAAAEAFASNFERQLGKHHEHHEHHQHHEPKSEHSQLLVHPGVRKPRSKNGSLLEAKSAAEPSAIPPAPDNSEEVAAEVAAPLSGPSNQAEEVLPWLQALPKELQLVEWLGRHGFLDRLCPCDINCLVVTQERYMDKHNCQETLWFDLISAWLKEPFVINLWLAVAPAPSKAAAPDVMDALFKVFKALPTYRHQEIGRVLKGGRGTGFMSFFPQWAWSPKKTRLVVHLTTTACALSSKVAGTSGRKAGPNFRPYWKP